MDVWQCFSRHDVATLPLSYQNKINKLFLFENIDFETQSTKKKWLCQNMRYLKLHCNWMIIIPLFLRQKTWVVTHTPTKMDTRKDRIQLSPIISHKFPLPYFLRYVFLVRKTPPPNPFLPRVEELTCTWHDEKIFETPFLGGSPKCNQFVSGSFLVVVSQPFPVWRFGSSSNWNNQNNPKICCLGYQV